MKAPTYAPEPTGGIAPPKPNLSRNVSPMHAALHAANSARLSAMDRAKAMAGVKMPSPMGAAAPKVAAPKMPGMKTPTSTPC